MSISKIKDSLSKTDSKSFPPVHLWEPELCVGQNISINREGIWFYNNSEIKNIKLVNLFSTVLRKDKDDYFLVTPTEKVPVKVEIAPYLITNFELLDDKTIKLDTNLDYSFVLNGSNTTRLIEIEGVSMPIVHVRNNIEGFFNRSTYYKLIDVALDLSIINNEILHIKSDGIDHPIGKIA